jgi:hypothetical protein
LIGDVADNTNVASIPLSSFNLKVSPGKFTTFLLSFDNLPPSGVPLVILFSAFSAELTGVVLREMAIGTASRGRLEDLVPLFVISILSAISRMPDGPSAFTVPHR